MGRLSSLEESRLSLAYEDSSTATGSRGWVDEVRSTSHREVTFSPRSTMDLDSPVSESSLKFRPYFNPMSGEPEISRDQATSSATQSSKGDKSDKPAVSTQALLPFEVKILIYNYVDLKTFKALRLVSPSWAAAGLEVLLLPTFFMAFSSIDAARLQAFCTSSKVSSHAGHVVKNMVFQTNDWDPKYLRSILLSRHEHRRHYEPVDFVPTKDEQDALEELDLLIKRRSFDTLYERDESWLVSALRHVPRVDTIQIVSPIPFQHRLLSKVWDEYALETYRLTHQQPQLFTVLVAVMKSGLEIRNLSHTELASSFFVGDKLPEHVYTCLSKLKSLNLVISDIQQNFSMSDEAIVRLRRLVSSAPTLESLSIKIESLASTSVDFLPDPAVCALHTLSLMGIRLEPGKLFAFLGENITKLRRLRIGAAEIPAGHGSWMAFLEELRDRSSLEKFEICGTPKEFNQGAPVRWVFWRIYDDEWRDVKRSKLRNTRSKKVEDFVVRGGPWPMADSDDDFIDLTF